MSTARPSPVSNVSQAKALVARWLHDEGATFVERTSRETRRMWVLEASELESSQRREVEPTEGIPTFRVIRPLPFAVEVQRSQPPNSSQPGHLSLWAQRLLALRLAVGERFGPSLPLLMIGFDASGRHAHELKFPFVDGVLSVAELPPLSELQHQVALDSMIQRILRDGDPGDPFLSDREQIARLWSNSIDLDQFLLEQKFVDSSLAARVGEAVAAKMAERPHNALSFVSSSERFPRKPDERSLAWTRAGSKIKQLVEGEVLSQLGGRFLSMPIPWADDEGEWNGRRKIRHWVSPQGRRAVIRVLSLGGLDRAYFRATHSNLITDPWLYRALSPEPLHDLILLLGVRGGYIPPTLIINEFQAVGWTVLPWDFSSSRPAFIEHLAHTGSATNAD